MALLAEFVLPRAVKTSLLLAYAGAVVNTCISPASKPGSKVRSADRKID